jgi:hypothetical protein
MQLCEVCGNKQNKNKKIYVLVQLNTHKSTQPQPMAGAMRHAHTQGDLLSQLYIPLHT